jgi:hypothetical protein
MIETTTQNTFKVGADTVSGKMDITLMKDGIDLGSVQIDTKNASALAGIILGTAGEIFRVSGKPNPYSTKEQAIDLTAIIPTGHNVGPGRKPGLSMLIFHFGDTALGIEVPNSDAQILGRRLMTAAAEGTAQ